MPGERSSSLVAKGATRPAGPVALSLSLPMRDPEAPAERIAGRQRSLEPVASAPAAKRDYT